MIWDIRSKKLDGKPLWKLVWPYFVIKYIT